MAKNSKQGKLGGLTRGLCLAACFLVMIPCVAIAIFGILDLAGLFPFLSENPNHYSIIYYDDGGNILFQDTKPRGEKFEKYQGGTPTKKGYEFLGWDIDNNTTPDIIPERAYQNIYAKPAWFLVDKDILTKNEDKLIPSNNSFNTIYEVNQ